MICYLTAKVIKISLIIINHLTKTNRNKEIPLKIYQYFASIQEVTVFDKLIKNFTVDLSKIFYFENTESFI